MEWNPTELRAFAAQSLPRAVVPTRWRAVDSLPRGATGKLDRRALPDLLKAPEALEALPSPPSTTTPRTVSDAAGVLSCTATARQMAAVWCSVLGVEEVGPDDDFFALGGDSLLCLKIALEARRRGLVVAAHQILEHPVLGDLAALVREVA
jgi:aryl carrier-like protein